ncbi:basic salivary proline-rich protein 2-like [Marmota monax]|uniref:basic salivary proline-rich protein 2-like n=1 Tax=Marmota monax TaxID=9995 RepID=UPI0026EC767B|nr:basic salivary proline-rich protein 2-like [Marmota monax]
MRFRKEGHGGPLPLVLARHRLPPPTPPPNPPPRRTEREDGERESLPPGRPSTRVYQNRNPVVVERFFHDGARPAPQDRTGARPGARNGPHRRPGVPTTPRRRGAAHTPAAEGPPGTPSRRPPAAGRGTHPDRGWAAESGGTEVPGEGGTGRAHSAAGRRSPHRQTPGTDADPGRTRGPQRYPPATAERRPGRAVRRRRRRRRRRGRRRRRRDPTTSRETPRRASPRGPRPDGDHDDTAPPRAPHTHTGAPRDCTAGRVPTATGGAARRRKQQAGGGSSTANPARKAARWNRPSEKPTYRGNTAGVRGRRRPPTRPPPPPPGALPAAGTLTRKRRGGRVPLFSLLAQPLMILPQVHLRKPCYDFYFL